MLNDSAEEPLMFEEQIARAARRAQAIRDIESLFVDGTDLGEWWEKPNPKFGGLRSCEASTEQLERCASFLSSGTAM